jgi:glycine oxidase
MLAAHDPENLPELGPLSDLSAALYPDYLNTVERLSGLQIPLRTSGTLQCVKGSGGSQRALTAAEIAFRVPELILDDHNFIWLDEHSLDPRDLCVALPRAAVAAGITLIEHTPVTRVRCTVTGVEVSTPGATWSGAQFVNCCGAWAGAISGVPSIEPCKGQMLTVKSPAHYRLDYVVRTPDLYLVPRGDGRVVIGASVEHAGFDKSVRETTIQALLDDASALWPPVREARVVDTWAGLRPGSGDGLPIMCASGEENCWIASGHFRNGILLAPATARVMRKLLLGEKPSVDLVSFRSDRFAAASVS